MRFIRWLAHVCVAIFGWVGFVWLWRRALTAGPTHAQLQGFVAVAIIDLAITIATLAWIRWNIGIYHRKGRRASVPPVMYEYSHDALGVPVMFAAASPCTEGCTRFIVVDLDSAGSRSAKRYTYEADEPLQEGEAS